MSELIESLRDHGCNLVVLDGWETSSYKGRTPKHVGTLGHHDASSALRNEISTANSYQRGIQRTDGFLPGPIYNGAVGHERCYLMADGYTNNAGRGLRAVRRNIEKGIAPSGLATGKGLINQNPYFWAITLLNNGVNEPIPETQLDQYLRMIAGVHDFYGWGPERHVEHRELTSRKIDPRLLPFAGAGVRDSVALHLLSPTKEPKTVLALHPNPTRLVNGRVPGWQVDPASGTVTAENGAPFYGDPRALPLVAPIVALVPAPDAAGYWLVGADGGVFSYGNVQHPGRMVGVPIIGADLLPDPVDGRTLRLTLVALLGGQIATYMIEGPTGHRLPDCPEPEPCPPCPEPEPCPEPNLDGLDELAGDLNRLADQLAAWKPGA
ncbi:MAG: N-acetylmuramoyl-L-alanine amidase [Actinomycetota bacterium]